MSQLYYVGPEALFIYTLKGKMSSLLHCTHAYTHT